MTLILGTLLFVNLILCCFFVMVDIHEECEWQTLAALHEEELGRLWDDEAA